MSWNVQADGWTNGRYCLSGNVPTREEAEHWVTVYRNKYEGKLYPNGLGFYQCFNFRAVEVIRRG